MTYQIADEPIPTSLGEYVVRPSGPLIAAMMCGAWLSWPWFAFNSIAMGSPTKKKELTLIGLAFGGTALLGWILIKLIDAGLMPAGIPTRLSFLAIATYKLVMTYWIAQVQQRTFHVYAYYGGKIRAASAVLSVGYYLRHVIFALSDDPLWIIIVAGGI